MPARFRCTIALTVAFAACLGAPGAIADQSDAMATQPQPVALEPEVVAAHARALGHFPAFLRARLADIPIERRESYAVPDDAPLASRLMAVATLAIYSNGTQTITIFDAGARGEPRWTIDLTTQEHREAVAAFLDALAEPLGESVGDTPALWRSFVDRIPAWAPAAEPDTNRPFADDPPLGCPRVFDAFVRLGVPRALGGTPPLEHLIVHELAHAMQLRDGGGFAMAHMRAWGSLAGWRRISTGEPFDGYAQGGFRMENPETLIALLLAADAADAPRVNALYGHHPAAHFINTYARFDPREDFAECVRLFATDPDRLIEVSPERFVFINAMGWCAELDAASPGPLWYDAAEIVKRGWQPKIQETLAAMLAPSFEVPQPDLRVVAALVRAHAELLDTARLPPPNEAFERPPDLPRAILRERDVAVLTPVVGGVEYPPPGNRLMNQSMLELFKWRESSEFLVSITQVMRESDPDADDIRAEFVESRAMAKDGREMQVLILAADAAFWAGEPRVMREAVAAEAEHHAAAGQPLLAERLRLSIALHDPMLSDADRSAEIERIERLARAAPLDEHTVEMLTGIARHRSAELGPEGVIEMARTIPGTTLGAIRRVELLFDAANRIAEESGAEGLDTLWTAMLQEYRHGHHHMVRDFSEAMARASMSEAVYRAAQPRQTQPSGDESPSPPPSDQKDQP